MACYFIGTTWAESGYSLHCRAQAEALVRRGHTVVLLVDGQNTGVEDHDGNPAIYTWPSPRPTHPQDFRFLNQLVDRYRPDCLIAHFGAVNVMTLVGLARRVPQRIAWYRTLSAQNEADRTGPLWKDRFQGMRKALVYRAATWVVGNSAAAEADVRRAFHVPARKTRYFYPFLPDPIARLGLSVIDDDKREGVVCVGRLVPSKGQDVVVRAVALLKAEFPSLCVDFLGEGPRRHALTTLAHDLDVTDQCRFTGRIPYAEVFAKMIRAQLSVVASRDEAFGMAAAESLAVGTPVVGSDVGGIREIVRGGVDGQLVPPDDPAALAARLRELLRDAGLRRKMSANARDRFLSKFEQTRAIDQQTDWLESVVSSGR